MKKITRMNEAAWLLGVVMCALGVALCTQAGFGISMIAAPPYIIHLKLYSICPFFTHGVCDYLWQGLLMVLMCACIRKFKLSYIFSFATGVIFGMCVDMWTLLFGGGGVLAFMPHRIAFFCVGELTTATAIAFFFRTAMPVEVYELIVAEFARKFKLTTNKMKMINDICMLALAVTLALTLNGSFKGLGIGTVIITALNAPLITLIGKLLDKYIDFSPRFPKLMKFLNGELKKNGGALTSV